MAGGVVQLAFVTGLGVAIAGLIVVVISVLVVGLALRSQASSGADEAGSRRPRNPGDG